MCAPVNVKHQQKRHTCVATSKQNKSYGVQEVFLDEGRVDNDVSVDKHQYKFAHMRIWAVGSA